VRRWPREAVVPSHFSSAIFEDGRLLVAQMFMVTSTKTALARAFEMSYGAQLNSVLILCVHSI
jgi:hypothetical protein